MDASHAQAHSTPCTLTATGEGARELRISYISEVPVWKTTYRIVLPPASQPNARPLLQGWAIVDNTVGEDWNNVELSLAAGAPQSFIQESDFAALLHAAACGADAREGFMMSPQLHAATLSEQCGRNHWRDQGCFSRRGRSPSASITVKDRNSNTAGIPRKRTVQVDIASTGLSDAAVHARNRARWISNDSCEECGGKWKQRQQLPDECWSDFYDGGSRIDCRSAVKYVFHKFQYRASGSACHRPLGRCAFGERRNISRCRAKHRLGAGRFAWRSLRVQTQRSRHDTQKPIRACAHRPTRSEGRRKSHFGMRGTGFAARPLACALTCGSPTTAD